MERRIGHHGLEIAGWRTLGLSPDSKHLLYWQDGHVHRFTLESREHKNLTEGAAVSFVDVDFDHPGEAPPYGVAGWTEDGEAVVLEHRYDLWRLPLFGATPPT